MVPTLVLLMVTTACTVGAETAPAAPRRLPRIGYLAPGGSPLDGGKQALLEDLAKLGYTDGHNIEIAYRFLTDTRTPPTREAAELAQMDLDVVVAIGVARAIAMRDATRTIPIVMASVVDPVDDGLIESFAHPGGNVTGTGGLSRDLMQKRLEILKQALPGVTSVAVLATPHWSEPNTPMGRNWRAAQEAASQLAITLELVEVPDEAELDSSEEIDRAISAAAARGAEALFPLPDAFFDIRLSRVASSALRNRLPAIYRNDRFCDLGGLIAYGPSFQQDYETVALYVDRIIHGEQPKDLPVVMPSRFDLTVNLDTADLLGIPLPDGFVAQTSTIVRSRE